GLDASDLEAVPDMPQAGLDQLARPLRTMLQLPDGPAGQAWLGAHAGDWGKTGGRVLLPELEPDDPGNLQEKRTPAGGGEVGDGLTLGAVFDCTDATAAAKLEGYLIPEKGERPPLRVLGRRPEMEPVAQELAQTLIAVRQEARLRLQATAGAETVQRALNAKGE